MTNNLESFAKKYIEQHPSQAMMVFDQMDLAQAVDYLLSLNEGEFLKIAPFISTPIATQLLAPSNKEMVASLIDKLPVRLLVRWVWFVKPSEKDEVLALLKPEKKKIIQGLLNVPKDVVGFVANINIPPVIVGTSIKTCLSTISSAKNYGSNYIYVVDRQGKLIGVSSLRKLFLAMSNEGMCIESIMIDKVSTVFYHTRILDLVSDTMWAKYDVLPVVDSFGEYLGAISHKQIRALDPLGSLSKKDEIRGDLGELYSEGMFSLLEGVCSIVGSDKREDQVDD